MKRAAWALAAHYKVSPHFPNEVAQIQSELTAHCTSLQQTLPAAGLYLSADEKQQKKQQLCFYTTSVHISSSSRSCSVVLTTASSNEPTQLSPAH